MHTGKQAVLVELLMTHPIAHVEHHRAAEQQALELIGVPDRRRVEQVLVRALVLKRHEASMLLVAPSPMQPELYAALADGIVIAYEELVDEHRVRRALGHGGEQLALGRAHIACVHCKLDLCRPRDAAARGEELRVQHAPGRRAQLVRPLREEPREVEPGQVKRGAVRRR